MYTIRATKVKTEEFVDMATFRSIKKAMDAIILIEKELANNLNDGDTIKGFLGTHQFIHTPKGMNPILFHITVD